MLVATTWAPTTMAEDESRTEPRIFPVTSAQRLALTQAVKAAARRRLLMVKVGTSLKRNSSQLAVTLSNKDGKVKSIVHKRLLANER